MYDRPPMDNKNGTLDSSCTANELMRGKHNRYERQYLRGCSSESPKGPTEPYRVGVHELTVVKATSSWRPCSPLDHQREN